MANNLHYLLPLMFLSLLLLYLMVLLSLLLLQQIGLMSVVFILVFWDSVGNFLDFPKRKELYIIAFFLSEWKSI